MNLIANVRHTISIFHGSIPRDRLDLSGEGADLDHALRLLGAEPGEALPRGVAAVIPRGRPDSP